MTYFFNRYIYVDIFIIVFYLPYYCNIRYVVLSFDEIKTHYFIIRKNGHARGRQIARGEGVPARKAPENRSNSHSMSADISNWSRDSRLSPCRARVFFFRPFIS